MNADTLNQWKKEGEHLEGNINAPPTIRTGILQVGIEA
jgi:hypothetical protein